MERIIIKRKRVSEEVSDQIENMLFRGEYSEGDKLPPVRELCELFGVGRSAVRDALTALQVRGLITVKQGEGAYVTPYDPAKIFSQYILTPNEKQAGELFQVRRILEPKLAAMAAKNRSDKQLAEMKAVLKNSCEWESDFIFHQTIARAAGNDMILHLLKFITNSLKKAVIEFHESIQHDPDLCHEVFLQHEAIYNAIAQKLPEEANVAVLKHLQFVEVQIQQKSKSFFG